MQSTAYADPHTWGLIINLFIGLLLASPLLFIFIRARHQPNSILWKAVYVPRTWWPPDPSKRTHRTFDGLPNHSLLKSILLLFSGSSLRLVPPQNSSPEFQDPQLFTDEEIHLRFLALGLRLSLLGLLLGLPICLTLFIADVPLIPAAVRLSSLENLTSLRLLYRFDLNPTRYITKLNLWAVFSLLIGSILAFGLILIEWNYLNTHLRRFSHSKCGDLQIVFLPADPRSGLDQIGEKEMVEWVRACKLGPPGTEGDGLALEAEIRARRGLFEKAHQRQQTRSDSDTYANLQDHPQLEFGEAGQRGVIIHGVFTISNLDQLSSLSESRRKVLEQLELAEAKYVAGFIPEDEDPSQSKHAKGKRPLRKIFKGKLDEELDTRSLTPYGPSTFYRLETQQPRIVNMSWESPTLDWGSSELLGEQSKRTDDHFEVPLPSASLGPKFSEVHQDLDLPNARYRAKWAIGNQIEVDPDGTLCSLPPPTPATPKSRPLVGCVSSMSFYNDPLHGSASSALLPHSQSPLPSGRFSPVSVNSTEATHIVHLPSITPTSAKGEEPYFHAVLTLPEPAPQVHGTLNVPRISLPSQRSSTFHAHERSLKTGLISPNQANRDSDEISESVVHALFEIPDPLRHHAPVLSLSLPSPLSTPIPTTIPMTSSIASVASSQRQLRPHRFMRTEDIKDLYRSIRQYRSSLKRLNSDFVSARAQAIKQMEYGTEGSIRGWMVVGKGVELIKGAQSVIGMTRDDVRWQGLGKRSGKKGKAVFWGCVGALGLVDGILLIPIAILITTPSPELMRYSNPLRPLQNNGELFVGLLSITLPSVLTSLLLFGTLSAIAFAAKRFSGLPSRASAQLLSLKASVVVVIIVFTGWLTTLSSVANSVYQFQHGEGVTNQLANSLSSVSTFYLSLLSLLALVVPAIVIGQPRRWHAIKAAINSTQTPRQRVKSLWPEDMDGLLSRCSALVFGSVGLVFLPIAPLTIIPGAFFFIVMILAQHRNIRSLYRRSSQSGGRTELTMVSMLGLAPSLQSALLGLILLSRNQYTLASIAYIISLAILGTSIGLLARNCRRKRRQRLDPRSRLALDVFERGPNRERKRSFSKVFTKSRTHSIDWLLSPLESPSSVTRLVPLPSETVDDVLETRLALRTYPDAPPHLPDLPWKARPSAGAGGEMLYPPILLQGGVAVMLPKDGVAGEEAKDMMKYWDLEAFFEEGMSTQDLNLR